MTFTSLRVKLGAHVHTVSVCFPLPCRVVVLSHRVEQTHHCTKLLFICPTAVLFAACPDDGTESGRKLVHASYAPA